MINIFKALAYVESIDGAVRADVPAFGQSGGDLIVFIYL